MICHKTCPACANNNFKTLSSFPSEQLCQCSRCSLVFEQRIPSDAELAAHYSQYGYSQQKPCPAATQASYRQVLSTFQASRGHGRLLDFGCGQGDFLQQATAAGWQAQGLEYSSEAIKLCRSRGLRVTQGDASTLIRQGAQFDVISAFEVLEHLRSPGDLLRDARALLTPSGLLYLTTPNFNSLLRHLEGGNFSAICYPDHLCFFSPQSLRQLARKHGLKVARLRTTGLDPWRLKTAMLPRIPRSSSSHSNDQDSGSLIGHASPPAGCRAALREATYSSRWGALAKGGVNTLVSLFGCGDTLKAWLVKK